MSLSAGEYPEEIVFRADDLDVFYYAVGDSAEQVLAPPRLVQRLLGAPPEVSRSEAPELQALEREEAQLVSGAERRRPRSSGT